MIQKKVRIRFTVFGVMTVTILNKWSDRGHNLKRGDIMTSVGAGRARQGDGIMPLEESLRNLTQFCSYNGDV